MEVMTSAVHSAQFLHSQLTQFRTLFIPPTPKKLHLPCYHHPNHLTSAGCSIRTSAIINSNSATTDTSTATTSADDVSLSEVENIKQKYLKWKWKGQYSINYFVSSDSDSPQQPPLLLVHGFGASIPHWRRNIKTLAQNYTVYAIDLLGFGASDKPPGFSYTMETWAQLILDFLEQVIQKPTVLIGNSVGSLACLIAASVSNQIQVKLLLEELCC